jgi:hypothetical protein
MCPGGRTSDPYRIDPRPNEVNVARLSGHRDSLGVPILNPVNKLRETSQKELLYYPRDGHLNARGTQVRGQILTERLIAENRVVKKSLLDFFNGGTVGASRALIISC